MLMKINGTPVFEIDYLWRWGGELGFRNIEIIDFEIDGRFLALEEFLQNSPDYGREISPVEVVPVVLPEGNALVDNNWHLGWPVATKCGEAIIVAFSRAQHHHGSPRPAYPTRSPGVVVRSMDGGNTWSDPVDLKSFIKTRAKFSPSGMRAITTTSNGTVVYLSKLGVFRSEDGGINWIHYPDGFQEFDSSKVRNYNLGPNIIEADDGTLYAFSHVIDPVNLPQGQVVSKRWWAWVSRDDGRTWWQQEVPMPEGFHSLEPAFCLHDGNLFSLGRLHNLELGFDEDKRLYHYVQMHGVMGEWGTLDSTVSGIASSWAVDVLIPICPQSAHTVGGFWSQDTADISYNPVTERLEAVVTNRSGGGLGEEDDFTLHTLNLWSMDTEDFKKGKADWRFEGTLLRRYIMDITKRADGMHPAASVLDIENGVQHIFVYLGYRHGPAGIFRVTRSLDTEKIRHWWSCVKTHRTDQEKKVLRAFYSSLGEPEKKQKQD